VLGQPLDLEDDEAARLRDDDLDLAGLGDRGAEIDVLPVDRQRRAVAGERVDLARVGARPRRTGRVAVRRREIREMVGIEGIGGRGGTTRPDEGAAEEETADRFA
jgi:hypothetical protein